MKTVLSCRVCLQKSVEFEATSNVGSMEDRSGYRAVFTHDGALYLCPECVAKLKPHIGVIAAVFGDASNSLSWYALMKSILR